MTTDLAGLACAAVLEQLHDGVIVSDASGRIVYANDLARELYGAVDKNSVVALGADCTTLTLEGAPYPTDELPLTQALRGDLLDTLCWRIRRADGTEIIAEGSARPLVNKDGVRMGALHQFRDVSTQLPPEAPNVDDRRAATEVDLYRFLADAVPHVVYSALADGTPDYLNKHWYEYTGAPRGEDPYSTWHATLHPDDFERSTRAWIRSLNTGEPFEVEYRLRGTDGLYRWFLACGIPHKNADGVVVRWFGTATNIDRQKRAEEKQRFISRLSTSIHSLHEVEDIKSSATQLLGEHLSVSQAVFLEIERDSDPSATSVDNDAESTSVTKSLPFGTPVFDDLRSGRTVIVPDTAADPRTSLDFAAIYAPRDIRSFVASPLIKHGRLVAVLWICGSAPRLWQQDEWETVEETAERTWSALRSATEMQVRQRAAQAVQESETRFRMLVEQSPLSIQILSPSGHTVGVNRAWEELWGLTIEDLNDYNMLADAQLTEKGIMPYIRRAFDGEAVAIPPVMYDTEQTLPNRTRRPNSVQWTQAFMYPVKGEAGEIREIVLIHEDISERKRMEEAGAYLAAIIQSSEDAIVSKDLNGIITSWNPAAERIYGYTAAEMIGKSKSLVVPPDRLAELPTILRKIKSGERIDHFETKRVRKDGSLVDLSITVSPIRSANGQIVGASTIARDISERKELERRLREESQILETINDVGQRLSAELDLERMVQAATDAATQLTGAKFGAFFYNVANAAGESYMLYTISGVPRETFSQFPMPRNTEVFAPTFAGEGTVRSDDITRDPRYGKNSPLHGMPPGHLPVVSYLAVPVVSRSGEVLGGLFLGHEKPGIFTSRHDRLVEGMAAQAAIAIDNARLFQAERERSEQLATAVREVHHRVKNSLQGVSALLEIQLMPDVTSLPVEAIRDSLSQIKTIALVHDLLAHDKPIGDVDAAQVLSKLIAMLSASFGLPDRPLPIRLTADSVSLPIRYAIALALAVNELITNAAKHSLNSTIKELFSHDGTIDVSLQKREDEICVSVQDYGPGFPPGFDPVLDAHIGLELVQVLVTNDLGGAVSYRNVCASEQASGQSSERGARVEITFSAACLTD